MAAPSETRAEVLQAVHGAGFALSAPQLGRLHRAGLIESPRTRPLGRGKGTVSEFPPGTTARLLRVLELQRHEDTKKFSLIGWRLWWEDGGRLSSPARGLLADVAADFDDGRRHLADLMARAEQGDTVAEQRMEELYAAAEHGRVDGPIGIARRNAGRDGFSSVMGVLVEIATGRFDHYDVGEELAEDGTPRPQTTGALVEKALGLDRARRDCIGGNESRFSGSSEADLANLSRLIGRRHLAPLARAPDAALNEARVEMRILVELLRTFAPIVERTIGGDAAGYGTIGKLFGRLGPRTEAFALLAWLVLREQPALREGMQGLIAVEPQVRAIAETEQLSDQLVEVVPALGPLLTAARRAELTGDVEQAARMHAEIRRVSDAHREQVDRVFAEFSASTH